MSCMRIFVLLQCTSSSAFVLLAPRATFCDQRSSTISAREGTLARVLANPAAALEIRVRGAPERWRRRIAWFKTAIGPTEPIAPPPPLPEGWIVFVDASSGRPYYVFPETGETTWTRPFVATRPVELPVVATASEAQAPAIDNAPAPTEPEVRPAAQVQRTGLAAVARSTRPEPPSRPKSYSPLSAETSRTPPSQPVHSTAWRDRRDPYTFRPSDAQAWGQDLMGREPPRKPASKVSTGPPKSNLAESFRQTTVVEPTEPAPAAATAPAAVVSSTPPPDPAAVASTTPPAPAKSGAAAAADAVKRPEEFRNLFRSSSPSSSPSAAASTIPPPGAPPDAPPQAAVVSTTPPASTGAATGVKPPAEIRNLFRKKD